MKIIITGAGKVGYNLAKNLSQYHEVTVIDQNEEALERISEELDILPILGDAENPQTYKNLNDKGIDLFISVTNVDEANIISLLTVDQYIHVDKKIVRLKKTFFKESDLLKKLDVYEAVYPLLLTTQKVESLIEYAKANNVKSFSYTNAKLISVKIAQRGDFSIFVKNILQDHKNVIAVGVEREKRFIILNENDVIENGDLVYFFGNPQEIKKICSQIETKTPEIIKRCVIYGATDLGIEIAKALLDRNLQVKLIEKDPKLCEKASETLEGDITVINSKYSSHSFFNEEMLSNADIFIATTENDEYNIIKCMEASEAGIKKVVSINNDLEYYDLMHRIGITVVRGVKANAFYTILEKIESNYIITQKQFCGGKATIFLRKIFKGSPLIGKSIKAYPASENALSVIIRDENITPFYGNIECRENDVIVVFSNKEESDKIKKWINNL
ncbi:MAG: FAD-dependent oxidoreductase [Epsilonproteobacteria bacterium]|nr:FAD-dependent oxidoreductase [Campylobacterota bacterium]